MGLALQLALLLIALVPTCRGAPSLSQRVDRFSQRVDHFSQRVDHFSDNNTATFEQKYMVLNDVDSAQIVFLYISGEAPLDSMPNDAVTRIYAPHFNAVVVSLEHRYYGSSLPMGANFTVDALKYLTVEQALADLAEFVTWFARGRPVITFGCSYAGAMSAWFRIAYPNVTIGSISSSGVVNPILDFFQFDEQISTSLGKVDPLCLENLKFAYLEIDASLLINRVGTMKRFNATASWNVLDFLYFMADAAAETVQYGYQATLCKYLADPSKRRGLDRYANFVMEFYNPVYQGNDTSSYTRQSVAQTFPGNANRAWWWQTCSQLAYFQTAPHHNSSLRSPLLDVRYFIDFCDHVFAPGIFPNVKQVLHQFGGANPPKGTTDIYFFQSSQDPWQWAGVMSGRSNLDEYTVQCNDCGHCSDTRGCPSLPPVVPINGCANMSSINTARSNTIDTISKWLKISL